MKPKYREDKVTQMAALFLKLRSNNGKMHHLKLMKLLYLADRKAFLQLGQPISFDSCVSMDHGPVLSTTLNLIHGEVQGVGVWSEIISSPQNHEVSLISDPGNGKLSEAEEQIIQEVFEEHGYKNRWDLEDETHLLEEWQDPQGSSIKIEYVEILRAGKKTEGEIESIMQDLENLAIMDTIFTK